jgi:transcriptional regulator with XRE-family HTH domain
MSHIEEFAKDPENYKLLQQESLLLDVAALMHRAMKKRKINRTQLADLLGVTKGRVTQYLGGERNLTLRTLADIFTALGEQLEVSTCRIPSVIASPVTDSTVPIVSLPKISGTEGPRHAAPHDSH